MPPRGSDPVPLFVDAILVYLRAWIGALRAPAREVAPLRPRRLLLLTAFPLFLAVQLVHWLCLGLDVLLFPAFRRQRIERPVFIIGIPRSGTTFLHRALSADPAFTTTSTWELLFAPSLCQRYLLRALGVIDRRCGAPVARMLRRISGAAGSDLAAVHEVALDAPEEDYLALLPAAGCFFALLAFPASRDLAALGDLATLPPARRERLLDHYHALLQRHVFAHGGRQLLSKNAAFAGWGSALRQHFPDAEVLVCIRDPLPALSSQLSSLESARRLFGVYPDSDDLRALFLHCYGTWFERLAGFAERFQPLVIEQEWMARDAERVLGSVYVRLGRPRPTRFPAQRSAPPSAHRHDPAHFGLGGGDMDPALLAAYAALQHRASRQR